MRFEIESWIWFAFATGIIIARLVSRVLLFGSIKGLQYEDWIMGFAIMSCYTVLVVMANIEAKAQSNLLPPGFDVDKLTAQEISDRQYGSKIVIVVEQMQIAVIWSCKACLLVLYYRLTRSVAVSHHRAIRILSVYVGFSFVVMEILYFAAWCRPFSQYYAVPTSSSQCSALINHRITNAVFNISSDLLMLCIALTLFIRSLLPLKRKLVLCGIFSLGIFVILAAVLNKYYSFKTPYEPTWIFWYIREASTAILVANLPFTWTILRRLFNLGAFDEEHPPPPTYHSSRTAGGRRTARAYQTQRTPSANGKHSDSGGSNTMSLIGTIWERRRDHTLPQVQVSDNSQSENGLLEEAIKPVDFAPMAPADDDDIDLEQEMQSFAPSGHLAPANDPARAVSPSSSRRTGKSTRLSSDGTGGYVAVPRHAHLAPTTGHSRAPSVNSLLRLPIGSGAVERLVALAPSTGAGGGRSATDRKKRARTSN